MTIPIYLSKQNIDKMGSAKNPELLSPEPLNKESFLTTKIKNYVLEKPKQAFIIMFLLVVLSVIATLIHLYYVHKVEVPKYREMKRHNIFDRAGSSFTAPIAAAQNALELKEVIEELQYYRMKEPLIKRDSIRIKYLLDKYQLKSRK